MNTSLSPEVIRAIYSRESDEVIVPMLTIDSPEMEQPIRVVGDAIPVNRGGNTYVSCPLQIDLPSDEKGMVQSVRIRIENITRDLVEIIRTLDESPNIEVELVRAADPTDVVAGPWRTKLASVPYNATTLTAELIREHDLEISFPAIWASYTPENFPGLFG